MSGRPGVGEQIIVIELDDRGDERGASFSLRTAELARIGPIQDVHVAAVRPGHVRGNHFHTSRRELITVVYRGAWSLHWDTGPGTPNAERTFTGAGAVLVVVPVGWAHAVRNDGAEDLWLFAASDAAYRPDRPDAERRIVTEG